MLGFKGPEIEPKALDAEASEAFKSFIEVAEKLSAWAREYLLKYRAEEDEEETEVSPDLTTLIEKFKATLEQALKFNELTESLGKYKGVITVIEKEEKENDTRNLAVALAGLEF